MMEKMRTSYFVEVFIVSAKHCIRKD